MKNISLFLFTIFFICASAFGIDYGVTTFRGGVEATDSVITPAVHSSGTIEVDGNLTVDDQIVLGTAIDSVSAFWMLVRNKDGATILKGDVVEWDSTSWIIEKIKKDEASYAGDSSWDATITTEGGPFSLRFETGGTPDAEDSIWVYGDIFGSTATKDTIGLVAGANDSYSSKHLWNDLDSITLYDADGSSLDSVEVNGFSLAGVVTAITSWSQRICGIAAEDITDNSTGYIIIRGRCQADVEEGTTPIVPGVPLIVNTRGNLTNNLIETFAAGADTVFNITVGNALQYFDSSGSGSYTDSGLIWIEFDPR